MNVTEQVDAIRALGADPAKKLVLPRTLAAILVMPILSVYALFLGTVGAIFICQVQFGITPQFFMESALEATAMGDLLSGVAEDPCFWLHHRDRRMSLRIENDRWNRRRRHEHHAHGGRRFDRDLGRRLFTHQNSHRNFFASQ